jgi:selenide,water dikinase
VLSKLLRTPDPNLLVGFDKADDAGVYRLAPDLALVQTVDFFTPIVDDPYTFGQIAAANSLSDVYAMGAKALTALGVLCFPERESVELLEAILQGGLSKLTEAGCTLAGGHSVRDEDLKFGYSVTGTVHPDRIWTNAGARAGDALILTKALGTGVIATAVKRGRARGEDERAAIDSMCTLNRAASEFLLALPPHGATDITGFGLIGHAREMARASNVAIRFHAGAIPLLPGALDYAMDFQSKGLKDNRAFAECDVNFAEHVPESLRALLFDPQTSGGLLLAVEAKRAAEIVARLRDNGAPAAVIGEVVARVAGAPLIRVE